MVATVFFGAISRALFFQIIFRVLETGKIKEMGKLRQLITQAICSSAGVENFTVERTQDSSKGDLATNVAMVGYKSAGFSSPREMAERVVESLRDNSELETVISKIEIAGPGFINFYLKQEYVKKVLSDESAGCELMKGKRVLVEYSSPNIAKRFSVGHLRSTIIGNSLERIFKATGARVTNDNHLGDWGTQFGMIIAVVEEKDLDVEKMSVADLENEYVEFNKRMTETPGLREKAKEAFWRLEKGDASARKIWEQSVAVSMSEFDKIYKRLGVEFEHSLGESAYETDMPAIIKEAKKNKVAVEGENGAWVVKFEKDGKEYMPPAMLVKSDGTTTYFTRDLATIRRRLDEDELRADLYIYEVGGEQRLHLRQVFETVEKLGWAKKERFVHVAHGLLTLPEGKMSTRKGNTIKLEDLLWKSKDEARRVAGVEIADEEIEKLSLASVKYNELKRSPGLDYVFVWDEALSMEGNSAPYINYAYVRAKKIVAEKNIDGKKLRDFEGEEIGLSKMLIEFVEGDVVERAAKTYAPQVICNYLFELSKKFNAFYDHNRVLGDDREKERLFLVAKLAEVIKQGALLLGIDLVEKM